MQRKSVHNFSWAALACLSMWVTACGPRQADSEQGSQASPVAELHRTPAPVAKAAPAAVSAVPAPAPMVSEPASRMPASVHLYGMADIAQATPAAVMGAFREQYAHFSDNPIKRSAQEGVSTLSLDVDTGAYSNVRRYLNQGQLPPKDAVRVEELINYFAYDYGQATGAQPFAMQTEVAPAPWNRHNWLLRVGVKALEQHSEAMPAANLVFLVDVSGSMEARDKLPLVQASLRQLVGQLRPQDTVSLVVYAGRTAVELAPTSGREKQTILAAIDRLRAAGSTAGASALELAYQQARAAYIPHGINRILLATDGDFNVGMTDIQQIKEMVERQRISGISLTALGFGQGNYNEALMQQIAQVGNGNYSYIDSLPEARKVLVDELSATFNTVASDVKLQLEFNPEQVAEWRLIGYENRLLNEADFRNDQVDAVEVGAGKSLTALYEITLVGQPGLLAPRRYGSNAAGTAAAATGAAVTAQQNIGNELAEVRIRYKRPSQSQSEQLTHIVTAPTGAASNAQPSADWRFAAAVAAFGQQLRGGTYLQEWRYEDTLALAQSALATERNRYRHEFVQLVELAQSLQPSAQAPMQPAAALNAKP